MPSKEYYLELIEKEFATAREARTVGNDGMVRVCARRAAGHAIGRYLSGHPNRAWGSSALTHLAQLKDDPAFPHAIREAAVRLTARISENFKYSESSDPISDAFAIVDYFMNLDESDAS